VLKCKQKEAVSGLLKGKDDKVVLATWFGKV